MAKTAKTSPLSAAFKKRLKAANKDWKSAREKAAEGGVGVTEFEDGRYLARLVKAEIAESAGGRLQCVFHFKFEKGEGTKAEDYGGRVKFDYQGLESEQNLEFLGRRLAQLGYDLPEDLTEIQDILADLMKERPLCKIRLKTKGEFQNVYLDRVVSDEDEEDAADEEDETEESDAADESDDAEETDDEEEEEEAPPAKKSKKKAAKPEPEEEDEDDEEDDDAEEEEEEEEEPPAKKKQKAAAPAPAKKSKKAAPVEEEEEEEEAEEEDDEEESEDVSLEKGMAVVVETAKHGTMKGTVLDILEEEGKVRVKLENGTTLRVGPDKIAVDDDVPEEPVAKPKKKAKK